jgi:hypothetical protein
MDLLLVVEHRLLSLSDGRFPSEVARVLTGIAQKHIKQLLALENLARETVHSHAACVVSFSAPSPGEATSSGKESIRGISFSGD